MAESGHPSPVSSPSYPGFIQAQSDYENFLAWK